MALSRNSQTESMGMLREDTYPAAVAKAWQTHDLESEASAEVWSGKVLLDQMRYLRYMYERIESHELALLAL